MAVPPNDSNSLVGLPNLSDSKQMMYTSTDDSISIDDNHLGSAFNGALQFRHIQMRYKNNCIIHKVFLLPKP